MKKIYDLAEEYTKRHNLFLPLQNMWYLIYNIMTNRYQKIYNFKIRPLSKFQPNKSFMI